jgi:DNA-binding NtrC family response regulator
MNGLGLKRIEVSEKRLHNLRTTLRTLLNETRSKTFEVEIDPEVGIDFYDSVRKYEKAVIESALAATHGKQKLAAKLLRLAPSTLCMKVKQYGIDPSQF